MNPSDVYPGRLVEHKVSGERFCVLRRTLFGGYIVRGATCKGRYYRRRFRAYELTTQLSIPAR